MPGRPPELTGKKLMNRNLYRSLAITLTQRTLLTALCLSLFIMADGYGQCHLTYSFPEKSPGIFALHISASGSWPPPGHNGGEVELYLGSGPLRWRPGGPCVWEGDYVSICQPQDLYVGATCRDVNGTYVGESGSMHLESKHQPSIAHGKVSPDATTSGGLGMTADLTVHAPAAWRDRIVIYQWLPDLIDAGYRSVSDQTPDDFSYTTGWIVPAGQKFLKATIWSCHDKHASVLIAPRDNPCCCQATPTAPSCVAHPISVASGNMRMSDTDPLPSSLTPLSRTYDSTSHDVSGRFGMGGRSFLDSVLKSRDADGETYVTVETGEGTAYVFRGSGGVFAQAWPSNGPPATLLYDGSAYTLHEPQRDVETVVRASDGLPLKYHSRSSGRDVLVSYSGSVPMGVADSWGNWSWTLSTDGAGRVTAVTVDGTADTWQYTYDASGLLTTVRGPNNAAWRTYTYGPWSMMTEARDAAGRLIESHGYALARATSSFSDQGDVTSMTYELNGGPSERGTRVTNATGASTMYYVRWIAGRPRTTQIDGSCSGCGVNDAVYAYDDKGNIIREQDARGYVTTRGFDSLGRVTSATAGYKPVGCDPETDANHCRFSSPTLAVAALETTPSTATTTYSYGDSYWPDRPTVVSTKSVANPAQSRVATYTYDGTTGTVIHEQIDGWKSATEAER